MITDLRSRLKAVADKPKPAPVLCECMALESRIPLASLGAVFSVNAPHIRWLGLDFPGFDVRRALFLDTETTGLRGAGTVAFLVGLGWIEGEDFVVRQLLMRDYPEEVHLLSSVGSLLEKFDCVISFNGKSFDLPLLRDRFTFQRMKESWRELPHLDLLHAARRTWKLRLGSCTLGGLEEAVLGIAREGDLPGAEVPERFFRYLKCGQLSLLDDVLRHNEQDIRTLAALLAKLSSAYAQPDAQTDMLDVFSIGRALERAGEGELARRCFTVASVSELSQRARLELALSYRRSRDYTQAAETYRSMISRGEGGVEAYTALAILLERHLRDFRGALDVTEKAIWRYSGTTLFQKADEETLAQLHRRHARLKRTLQKSTI